MRCPSCNHENRETARFCGTCAAPLSAQLACPKCRTLNPTGQQFCDSCAHPLATRAPSERSRDPRPYTPHHLAEKILTSRSALEGERKQVTVLFADIKGSMDLAEQVDPEILHRIMDRFFAILADGVHRFEGTVNQYTGDGVMALFGAPIAHEDHAQRACYAALHLIDEIRRYSQQLRREQGLDFAVRIGLNSGAVVVGKIGDDLRMDYTAQGHTVGLAARVEQLAEAGKAYLTEHTAALVSGYFRLADLGEFNLRGVREPLRVYELESVGPLRTRLDVSRARGFSRFVGRQSEMAALEAGLEHAIQGHGHVIGVVAEAGVGKSRLCYEFAQRCRARHIGVTEAHGVAHGKAIPFLPVLEYLRGYFGITERHTEQAAREKIAGRVLLLDPELTEALPVLFDFLGVPDPERPVPAMDPECRQRELFLAMKRLVHGQSRREPGVSLIEDLHWIDGASETFLENFVDVLAGTRTLLVVNFRPEYRTDWMQKSYCEQLPLLPLDPEAITELLRELLGADRTLTGLADRINERTGGNPFFIEEVVHALVEAGSLEGSKGAYRLARPVDTLAIPDTVQAVLAARIDRLPERDKQTLQTAAVIGKEFSEPVLQRVAELSESELAVALRALRAAEFIYEQALYPEAEYAFKHPLTQEVAYHSQLCESRARVHAAVARTIEDLYPDRLDERAALLAHHWDAAGKTLEAARWHRRAAKWAGTRDPWEAFKHWRRVKALLHTVAETPDPYESTESLALAVAASVWILRFGYRLGISADEASTVFAEGRTLAERSGDVRSLANLVSTYGSLRDLAGDTEGSLEYHEEAARLADAVGDTRLQVALGPDRLHAYISSGRGKEGLAVTERLLELARGDASLGSEVSRFGPYIMLLLYRAYSLIFAGRIDEAGRQLDQTLDLARERGALETLCYAHAVYVDLAHFRGVAGNAPGHAREAVDIAERIRSPHLQVFAYSSLGGAYVLNHDWSNARAALERALAIVHERETRWDMEPEIRSQLSLAYMGAGDHARARDIAEGALVTAEHRGPVLVRGLVRLNVAHVLLRTDGIGSKAAIETALGQTLTAIADGALGNSWEPLVRVELAELARITGDDVTRECELREAHRLFTEMGATGHAERLATELGL